jgi:threonyl-tRNA synthetase
MSIETIRHSLAHILAAAVQELYPGTKFGIGPAIKNGFYYDFELPQGLALEDLPKIEKKMKELIRENIKFEKKIISKTEAKKLFKEQPYKLELIEEMSNGKRQMAKTNPKSRNFTIYKCGKFVDLCGGPHVKSTKEIPIDAFKLTKIAGAYWKGSERNPMLTRIYGIAFKTKRELEEYLKKEEEAEKRDHRLLGQKLGLFMIDSEVGAGLPLWLPKGAILRHIIEEYLYKELRKQGYQWLVTPHIAHLSLWKTSGHWNFYRENMYSPIEIDKEKYLLKPMNCPFHVKVYNSQIRSYKDLPLRFAELGTVYRYERSGVLHRLVRVRGFTQDDAHIWLAPEQLSDELVRILKFGLEILKTFGFKDYEIYLSTRPKKYIGSDKIWEKATNALKFALKKLKLEYQEDPGGGVFYGPKIDIKIKDSLGRAWQCTTIQVDFNLPERFKMTYIDKRGKKQRPIMIHRALLGSLERFIGVLIEHYGGAFPLWLAPEQIWIIPVGSSHRKYAQEVGRATSDQGFRVKIRDEPETVSKKIREGEIQKIPYLLVVGEKEMKTDSVRVRERGKGDVGEMKLEKFIKEIQKELQKKL